MINHYYPEVPGIGPVAVSRHAQARAEEDGISQMMVDAVLLKPVRPDVPDGTNILWRERNGIRLVILLYPEPYAGAALIKTMYRVVGAANAKKKGVA